MLQANETWHLNLKGMNAEQLAKIGGVAALIEAFTYAVGFALHFIFLDSSGYAGPVQKVSFPVQHQSIMHIGNLFIYVVLGIASAVLALPPRPSFA